MTTIIYITERCNIACEYCYQHKDREKVEELRDNTPEQIQQQLEKLKQEGITPSCFVLFGGEPLLRLDLVKFAVLKIRELFGSNIGINMSTNSLLLLNDNVFEDVKTLVTEHGVSIDISYDRSGHNRRVYKNGKSTKDDVERVLQKLEENDVPYRIRYTVHKANYDKAHIDWAVIAKQYSKCTRLIVSFNFSELAQILNTADTKRIASLYVPAANVIWDLFRLPVCELNCEKCRLCRKQENYRYITTSTTFNTKPSQNENFNHFTRSRGANE